MQKITEIFALWPTDASLGREIGLPYSTVAAWKQRESIPVSYWREIIRAARKRGHSEVTADLLIDLHTRTAEPAPTGLKESESRYHADDSRPAGSPSDEEDAPKPGGHFSRFKHLRRAHFASAKEINDHIRALREEWDRR